MKYNILASTEIRTFMWADDFCEFNFSGKKRNLE